MKSYVVIIESAGQNFSAYVPDLPGCVATGATIDETRELIQEAIEFHIDGIDGLREDGLSIPEPTTVAGVVEVPE